MVTICLACVGALALAAAEPDPPPAPTDGSATGLLDRGLLDGTAVPVTPPAIVDVKTAKPHVPLIAEGTAVLDRRTGLRRAGSRGKWVIDDPRVEALELLPCDLLESAEKLVADDPGAEFKLSGEVYEYRGTYYLMLRRVLRVLAAEKQDERRARAGRPATATNPKPTPATAPAPAASTPASAPASDGGATSDDVARQLLGEVLGRPVVAPSAPLGRVAVTPSVAPTAQPLPPGPGRMVVNRLGRLLPKNGPWRLLAFEADNTLREPPMQLLPNQHLRRMETLSGNGTARGVVFHVSGEIHQYRGSQYLLVRSVIVRRDLNQF